MPKRKKKVADIETIGWGVGGTGDIGGGKWHSEGIGIGTMYS